MHCFLCHVTERLSVRQTWCGPYHLMKGICVQPYGEYSPPNEEAKTSSNLVGHSLCQAPDKEAPMPSSLWSSGAEMA